MTADVLKEWAQQIEWANLIPRNRDQQCILSLVAALRAERERVAELEAHVAATDPWRGEAESKVTRSENSPNSPQNSA